mgnify:CR=1 FL=1
MKVWKSDNTKKIASVASAFSTKKEKTESEGDYIVNYFKRAADPNAADDLEPMAAINIVMTTAKAKCGISIHSVPKQILMKGSYLDQRLL